MTKKTVVKGKKWTPEQRAKFMATVASKKVDPGFRPLIESGEIPSDVLPPRPKPRAPLSPQKKAEIAAKSKATYQAKKLGKATAIQTDVRYQIALELIRLIRNILSTE